MATGKRPNRTSSAPWGRWALILAALVVAGGIVWWLARPGAAGGGAVAYGRARSPDAVLFLLRGPTLQLLQSHEVRALDRAARGPST